SSTCRTLRSRRSSNRKSGWRRMARRRALPWRRSTTAPVLLGRAAMRTGSSSFAGRLATLAMLGLAACAGPQAPKVAEPPTLNSLEGRQVAIAPDQGIEKREENAAIAYNDFLKAAPR